jgi:hypothetical protein
MVSASFPAITDDESWDVPVPIADSSSRVMIAASLFH